MALAAILAVSCNDGLRIESNEQVGATTGFLSLSALSVELVADHQPSIDDVAGKVNTRAAADINTFDCAIYDQSGSNLIQAFKYGQRPSSPIELEAGNYIFTISSGEVPAAAFESPVYAHTEPFTINIKQTTELTDMVCTLQNIQASVTYSVDLRQSLSDDTTATLTVGSSSLVFGVDETRSGFFKAEKALNDIDVLVKGMYTQQDKAPAAFEFTTTIKDVKAGQYSDIQLYIEYSSQGNISISVTIDGWVVDQEVVYNLAGNIAEDIIVDDNDQPVITLVGGDITEAQSLYATDFDNKGNCTKDIIVEVATKSAITSLVVDIASTNPTLVASLDQYGLSSTMDLCQAGAATAALKLMGLPVNDQVAGQTAVLYDITAQMKLLRDYVGSHTFTVTATDSKGGVTTAALTIIIEGKLSAPTILWKGYDIDKRYTVVSGMTVDIVVTAAAKVKDFSVQIVSDVLTPSELGNVGLCDVLNLAEPTSSYSTVNDNFDTSGIAQSLAGLGFPTGEAVKGQSSVEFSITQFLDLLAITGQGRHDFIMTVTDYDDNVTVKTLMIETVK